jgi:hypothetical protein
MLTSQSHLRATAGGFRPLVEGGAGISSQGMQVNRAVLRGPGFFGLVFRLRAVRPAQRQINDPRPAQAPQLAPDVGLVISPEPFAGIAQIDLFGFSARPATAMECVAIVKHMAERQGDHRAASHIAGHLPDNEITFAALLAVDAFQLRAKRFQKGRLAEPALQLPPIEPVCPAAGFAARPKDVQLGELFKTHPGQLTRIADWRRNAGGG